MTDASPRADALVDQLDSYLPELREYIRRRSGAMLTARESASDLAQSVCREVIEHIDRFEHGDEDGFRRWLYRTAERKIINRYRYYTAEKRNVAREVADVVGAHGALLFRTPSRDAMAREELVRAETAFHALPERYRVAIVLSRVKGLAHAEIAEHLGTSEGAVRNLVYRGLAAISESLAAGR